jgi:hypothetical protein
MVEWIRTHEVMKPSQACIDFIKDWEKLRLVAYQTVAVSGRLATAIRITLSLAILAPSKRQKNSSVKMCRRPLVPLMTSWTWN